MKVKRGDIYWCDLGQNIGSVQSGFRPVIVLQCNKGNNASPTTIVATITSAKKINRLPTHVYLGANYGLKKPSTITFEQIQTVDLNMLTKYIGTVSNPKVLNRINTAFQFSIGLIKNKPKHKCLCYKCMNKIRYNPRYIVRRKNKFDSNNYICEKCGSSLGKYYLIFEKEIWGNNNVKRK